MVAGVREVEWEVVLGEASSAVEQVAVERAGAAVETALVEAGMAEEAVGREQEVAGMAVAAEGTRRVEVRMVKEEVVKAWAEVVKQVPRSLTDDSSCAGILTVSWLMGRNPS